jgi:streptomycin 6-kinase
MTVEVPDALVRNVIEVWGDEGRAWLEALPTVLADVVEHWGLTLLRPYPMSYHWVARVEAPGGVPAVLKLGPPLPGPEPPEVAALVGYGGRGAVALLGYDGSRGALLLGRAEPGTPARALVPGRDAEATAAVIDVLHRLHAAPVPAGLPDLLTVREDFAEHLRRNPGDDPLPRALVRRAAALLDELSATAPRRVLLHGDLHHDNVLRHGAGWVAIDPHGWHGDPGFDAGPLLYNPDPDSRDASLLALVPARIEQLADGLGIPSHRVAAWGFVAAMLSEVWSAEAPGHRGGRPLAVARLLADAVG